jgi:hypothetical protein
MLFGRPAVCVLKHSAVEHAPVVLGPLGHEFAVASPTAGMAVLGAARPACRIAASATPATVCVTFGLFNVCHARASAS